MQHMKVTDILFFVVIVTLALVLGTQGTGCQQDDDSTSESMLGGVLAGENPLICPGIRDEGGVDHFSMYAAYQCSTTAQAVTNAIMICQGYSAEVEEAGMEIQQDCRDLYGLNTCISATEVIYCQMALREWITTCEGGPPLYCNPIIDGSAPRIPPRSRSLLFGFAGRGSLN